MGISIERVENWLEQMYTYSSKNSGPVHSSNVRLYTFINLTESDASSTIEVNTVVYCHLFLSSTVALVLCILKG